MKKNWPDWEVYKRDRCTCVYCGIGAGKFHHWRQLAIDHLVPVCWGGSNEPDNKVVACHRCNTMKGSWDPSRGTKPSYVSSELRNELIKRVKEYLNLDKSEERKDFDLMMGEL